jgi:hypothetical protein
MVGPVSCQAEPFHTYIGTAAINLPSILLLRCLQQPKQGMLDSQDFLDFH